MLIPSKEERREKFATLREDLHPMDACPSSSKENDDQDLVPAVPSSSPPQPPLDSHSMPQAPATSWNRSVVKVEPDDTSPVEDLPVFLNESGLKKPFTAVEVIYLFL